MELEVMEVVEMEVVGMEVGENSEEEMDFEMVEVSVEEKITVKLVEKRMMVVH
jgi:hypothetical protein